MALFAIPNPKKSISVDFPIDRVKLSVLNISLLNKQYKFTNSNEIFHQYTYEAYELLSLGVYIDIHLSSITENKTEITVEVRRKLGSFDQSHEVTKANEHLVKVFDCIAKLTAQTPNEIEALKNQAVLNSTDSKKTPTGPWYESKGLVFILCVFVFPVGLYALWKNSSIKKVWKIVWTIVIAFSVIIYFSGKKDGKISKEENVEVAETTTQTTGVGIGQVLKTEYFDITVNKAELQNSIDTGNPYSDLKPESGISYLVINATFKNTDNESRMLEDGSVWINYNGKDYEFDKAETIMAEGWGLLLEQINPLTSKTTNLVYKVPTEVKGNAYWQPGRANDDERILLGNL